MPNLTEKFYTESKCDKTAEYIETGSFLGDGIASVAPAYQIVHSIELAEKFYQHCCDRFFDNSRVRMYLGNSKKILPEILSTIHQPVTIYLDGHFSAGDTAIGDELINGVSSNPLLSELMILMTRIPNDIIIIDDCRMIGRRGVLNKGVTNGPWPEYEFDWTNITEEKVRAIMKPGYQLVKNTNRDYTDGAPDQWILFYRP